MDFGTIAAKMTLDISNFTSQLDLAQSQAQKLAQNASQAFDIGSTMTNMGKTLTMGVTLPLMGAATAAVKVGNEFQSQMSRVRAIVGEVTDGAFRKMQDQAIQLGAKTAFSAKEAAAGMENLASAGFSVEEIMGAIPGVLDLAAVSGGDVAASSEAMASSLRAFGLEATDAGHVANVFAKAAADTNAETGDMAEAMKYVAPVAKAMGLSLEETAASIGIMSDAGIKGSQAGTTLRGALSRIAKPTKAMVKSMEALGVSFYDANGNMIPLREQIGQLKKATEGLTQEEKNRHLVTLYGQQSLSGMLALMEAGPDKLDKLTDALINSNGAAQKMAETMQDNLKSKIEQMFGAMESAAIIIQQILEPMLSKIVGGITKLIEAFVNMSPIGQKMVVIFAGMVAALGPLLMIVGTAITTFIKLKVAIAFLGPAFMGTAGTIAGVIAIIYALVAVFMIAYTKSETFRNIVNSIGPAIKNGLGIALEWTIEKLKVFGEWLRETGSKVAEFGSAMGSKISGAWQSFMSSLGMAGASVGEFIENGLERLGGAFGKMGGVIAIAVSVISKIGLAMMGITGPIGMVISLIISLVSAWVRTGEMNADGLTKVFDNLGNTITNVADMISQQLPVFIEKGTQLLVNFIDGITAQIPALTAKISEVIQSVIQAMVTALPAIIEAGVNILISLIDGITQALPGLIQAAIQIIMALVNGLIQGLPALIDAAIQIITALFNALVQALPQILDAGVQILMALINGLIQSLPMIVEAVLQIIMALVGALIESLPQLIDAGIQLITALINGLISVIPKVIEAIIQIVLALVQALIAALPKLIDAGVRLITALVQGLIKVIPQVIAGAIQILSALLKAIIDHAPKLLQAGVQLIQALIQGILQLLGALVSAGANLIRQLLSTIGGFVGQMLAKGSELLTSFISGIAQKVGTAVSNIRTMGSNIVSTIGSFAGQMVSAGVNLVQGFVNGMASMIESAASTAANMAKRALDAAKSFLGIKSPSRKMMQIGKWTGEGMVIGLENMISTVADKAEMMAEAVTEALSGVQMSIDDNGIVETAKQVYQELAGVVPTDLPSGQFDSLRRASESTGIDLYSKADDEPDDDGGAPGGDPEPTGGIHIGTIVVRSNDDVDKLSRGLYNKSKEILSGMGNVVTP